MQLKSQRKTVFAAVLLASASLAMAGCSKKEEPVAETPPPVEAAAPAPAPEATVTTPPADAAATAEAPPAVPAETPPAKP